MMMKGRPGMGAGPGLRALAPVRLPHYGLNADPAVSY